MDTAILIKNLHSSNPKIRKLSISDNHRKQLICQINTRLDYCKDIQAYQVIRKELQDILDDEKTAFENMSESMQQSERGQTLAASQACLEETIDAVESIIMPWMKEIQIMQKHLYPMLMNYLINFRYKESSATCQGLSFGEST